MAGDDGQVWHGGGRGLVQDDDRTGPDRGGAAGLALAGEVAEELGGVLRDRDAGLQQNVPPGAGGRDAEYLAHAGGPPGVRDAYRRVGLAGPGRADDQLRAARAGQRNIRGGGLVQPQPALRDAIGRGHVGTCADQRLELRVIGAEQPRGFLRREMRRAVSLRVREELLLHR